MNHYILFEDVVTAIQYSRHFQPGSGQTVEVVIPYLSDGRFNSELYAVSTDLVMNVSYRGTINNRTYHVYGDFDTFEYDPNEPKEKQFERFVKLYCHIGIERNIYSDDRRHTSRMTVHYKFIEGDEDDV